MSLFSRIFRKQEVSKDPFAQKAESLEGQIRSYLSEHQAAIPSTLRRPYDSGTLTEFLRAAAATMQAYNLIAGIYAEVDRIDSMGVEEYLARTPDLMEKVHIRRTGKKPGWRRHELIELANQEAAVFLFELYARVYRGMNHERSRDFLRHLGAYRPMSVRQALETGTDPAVIAYDDALGRDVFTRANRLFQVIKGIPGLEELTPIYTPEKDPRAYSGIISSIHAVQKF